MGPCIHGASTSTAKNPYATEGIAASSSMTGLTTWRMPKGTMFAEDHGRQHADGHRDEHRGDGDDPAEPVEHGRRGHCSVPTGGTT